jgi:hypothetical protein
MDGVLKETIFRTFYIDAARSATLSAVGGGFIEPCWLGREGAEIVVAMVDPPMWANA